MKKNNQKPVVHSVVMSRSEWFVWDATAAALGFCLVETARFLGKKAVKALQENREAKKTTETTTQTTTTKKKKAG